MRHILTLFLALVLAASPALASGITVSRGSASATAGGFVTTGAQTITGKKSWIETIQLGVAVAVAEWGVSDDATGRVIIEDGTSSNAIFVPVIRRVQNSTLAGLDVYQGTTDTGTNPINAFRARINTNSSVSTRPLFTWQNNATTVMALAANGGLSISGGSASSLTVGASGTAITQVRVYSQALDVASVAANTTAEQTFTVTGLTTADFVAVNKPSLSAGLGIVNVRASAADTLAITFSNNTGSAIDPASETYKIKADRS